MKVQIENSWQAALQTEFEKDYFKNITSFLKTEKANGKIIYPIGTNIFNAFNTTPFDQVKVVILGQDPYHSEGQAHGLSFSVQKGVAIPPSLQNIYKELHTDVGFTIPQHGCLQAWAEQGVLLLNASLSVEKGMPMSHAKISWHTFTDAVIKKISEEKTGVIFLLWGKFAQEKKSLIDTQKHAILMAPHPSPFSVHTGFWGCKHFSKVNEILQSQHKEIINWQIV